MSTQHVYLTAIYVLARTYLYKGRYAFVCACTCVRVYACMHACMHARMYTYTSTRICQCMYMYTFTYTWVPRHPDATLQLATVDGPRTITLSRFQLSRRCCPPVTILHVLVVMLCDQMCLAQQKQLTLCLRHGQAENHQPAAS